MSRNWAKWVSWPTFFHNEEQERIQEIRRAIKERRREPLPGDVDTSEAEIVEMATVIEDHGFDPERFLRILHQDSQEYGVEPAAAYVTDDLHERPHWPEGGFGLTMDELEWLSDVCCDVAERADNSDDNAYEDSPVERLGELCEFLTSAQEIEVPPSVFRGDQ